jgi:hypothetical protein
MVAVPAMRGIMPALNDAQRMIMKAVSGKRASFRRLEKEIAYE